MQNLFATENEVLNPELIQKLNDLYEQGKLKLTEQKIKKDKIDYSLPIYNAGYILDAKIINRLKETGSLLVYNNENKTFETLPIKAGQDIQIAYTPEGITIASKNHDHQNYATKTDLKVQNLQINAKADKLHSHDEYASNTKLEEAKKEFNAKVARLSTTLKQEGLKSTTEAIKEHGFAKKNELNILAGETLKVTQNIGEEFKKYAKKREVEEVGKELTKFAKKTDFEEIKNKSYNKLEIDDLLYNKSNLIHSHNWDNINGLQDRLGEITTTSLGAVVANTPITGATKTKITYDTKGLVTSGADATTADIADSLNKRYVTDANLTVLGNTSNTNSGDNATNSQYSGLAGSKQDVLVSGTSIKTLNSTSLLGSGDIAITGNATHTGDATGSGALTVVAINGTSLAGLATGILKNTTTTGVPSIAVAGDFPTLNQNTTGTATNATNAVNTGITDDTTTNATMYPTWVTTTTGSLPVKVSSTKLYFNPSTGALNTTTLNAVNATLTRVSDANILILKGHSTQTNAQILIQNSSGSELARIFANSNQSLGIGFTAGNAMGTASNAVYIGPYAGAQATGASNTLIGSTAGYSIVAGIETVAVGYEAGRNSTGSYSTYVGTRAGYSNTANNNTYIGSYSGYSTTSGVENTAIGTGAMRDATASYTTAIGANAGYKVTGNNNFFAGGYAGYNTTSGVDNVAIGVNALRTNITHGYNTIIGGSAGYNNVANNNTFIGSYSGYANTSGAENMAIGVNALRANQTGTYLVAIGNAAGYANTASYNTFIGGLAGYANTSGGYNVGIGFQTLRYNSTSSENVAIGDSALFLATAGPNLAIGRTALYNNTTGTQNVGYGNYALSANQTGFGNVAIGNYGLYATTGSSSVSVGYAAGFSNTNGGCVFLGYQAGYNETTANKLYIANSNTATPLIYGDFATPNVTINGNLTIQDAKNIIFATTTGTKIGTGATQKIGFWNATPVVQSTGWGATNVTTDKEYDANPTTLDEVADTLGTLIDTLKTYGILGA